MKRIAVITTGGTIASLPGPDGRNIAGAIPGDQLVADLIGEAKFSLTVHSLFQKASIALTPSDLVSLAKYCQKLIDAKEVDGIVITHGTDTLEETSYFLDSTLRTDDVVVVMTGAQRVPHAMGSDSATNLRDALLVAASDTCTNMGVLVVFNETVHAAAFVRKVSSFQLHGFDSPVFGCLGFVDDPDVLIYQNPRHQKCLPIPDSELPTVEMLSVGIGSSSTALSALIDAGVSGIVLEATGRGQVPPNWIEEVQRATNAGITTLVTSVTLHGPVRACYEYPGSLHDLENAGAIGISGLSARKARMRLMLILAAEQNPPDRETLENLFAWY